MRLWPHQHNGERISPTTNCGQDTWESDSTWSIKSLLIRAPKHHQLDFSRRNMTGICSQMLTFASSNLSLNCAEKNFGGEFQIQFMSFRYSSGTVYANHTLFFAFSQLPGKVELQSMTSSILLMCHFEPMAESTTCSTICGTKALKAVRPYSTGHGVKPWDRAPE